MIEAAMLSLLSAMPVRSTVRAGGQDVAYSDKFIFVPSEELPEGDSEGAQALLSIRGAAISGILPEEVAYGPGVLGSPASGRFETLHEIAHGALLTGCVALCAEHSAFSGIFERADRPSDLVDAIERTAASADANAILALVEATLAHASAAVRASAVEAAERILPDHPALIARLNWLRGADPSAVVRTVAGEVLDYLD